MRLLLLCGPAFSGKTTLSYALEAHGVLRVSLDDILRSRGLEPGAGLPERTWQDASFAACLLISAAAQRGQNVVLDDTLCLRSLRDRYRDVGADAGMAVFLLVMETSAAAIRERVFANLQLRKRQGMDEALLARQLASFEWPGADEPHIELDGTSSIEAQLSQLRRAVAPAAARQVTGE